jgi:4-hydroxy-3-polyprenylbenzoate decarboxylase
MNKRITVAVTGASGALYAVRLLRYLLMHGFEVDFIISDAGRITFKVEMGVDLEKTPVLEFMKSTFPNDRLTGSLKEHNVYAISSSLASGSVRRLGMVVIPCSMKTLSGMAHGASANLIERAADVALKEGFPLVIVPRETPMNTIQIENMLKLAQAGAKMAPAMPAFYQEPESLDDLADFMAARVLNLLGVEDHGLFKPWGNQTFHYKGTENTE